MHTSTSIQLVHSLHAQYMHQYHSKYVTLGDRDETFAQTSLPSSSSSKNNNDAFFYLVINTFAIITVEVVV